MNVYNIYSLNMQENVVCVQGRWSSIQFKYFVDHLGSQLY